MELVEPSRRIEPTHPWWDLKTRRAREGLLGFFLLLPAFTVIALIVIRPLVSNLWQSLFRIDLMNPEQGRVFVGLDNIGFVLTNRYVLDALQHSIVITFAATSLTFLIAFCLALLLDKPFFGRNVIRSLLILPWAVPAIVAAFAWQFLADVNYGMINHWLLSLDLVNEPINWLAYPRSAWALAVAAHVWKGMPFMLIVLTAGLKQIPNELYDAAKVDGASGLGLIRHVVIPSMQDVIAIALILRTIWFFNWFDFMYLLTGGGPARATETLPLVAYRTAFREFRLGRSSAIADIMFLVLVVLCVIFFRYRATRDVEEV